ncbi:alpha-L-rhamnosidase C-terminal domain-containing protein [Galbitalea soli]|uniref:Bacterial alpha-L-rhamnosidase n=1 Tax=Galbitalea soli TaxID=1268042 RepID=A0A7C9PML9_9MICO|nr:hypothetical protein [Galbitalea soli]NYJ29652.1 hypothetical protein [Galbitalea soli]
MSTDADAVWIYPAGILELAMLQRIVHDGFAAGRHVDYPATAREVPARAEFRMTDPGPDPRATPATLLRELQPAPGCAAEFVDGVMVVTSADRLVPPALLVPALLVPTGRAAPPAPIEARVGAGPWEPATLRRGPLGRPPHRAEQPTTVVPMREVAGMFELEQPVLGRPVIHCNGVPTLVTGESRDEARAAAADQESRFDLVQRADGSWTSVHRLGFRFARVTIEPGTTTAAAPAAITVEVEAAQTAHPRRGAFACSEARLTEIWSVAADTLELCMQGLMVDGIKRDRMPWMGDQALTALSNAYAVGDAQIARDSLVALAQLDHGYVNGISDYSLWLLVTAGTLVRFLGELDLAAAHLDEHLERLRAHADEHGVLRPPALPDTFVRVFIDWGVTVDPGRDSTALQLLWFWAVSTVARLQGEGSRWAGYAETIRRTVIDRAWDDRAGVWREYLDDIAGTSPYPTVLAILSGAGGRLTPGVLDALREAERVGTPFMTSFALRALAMAGDPGLAVDRIARLWGAMLDEGARTFWEDFPEPDGGSPLAMYGRPFGRSLCHAWASGPAALLPEIVCGVVPLADGWRRVRVEPLLGALDWATATVPTPFGALRVEARREQATETVASRATAVTVWLPAGVTLERADGSTQAGPGEVRWVSP